MNAAPFLACVTEENALTLLEATSAPVHEATSPAQMVPDVWVSHTGKQTFFFYISFSLRFAFLHPLAS